jgi:hypothetical protein
VPRAVACPALPNLERERRVTWQSARGAFAVPKRDPEKWGPVSRLREAVAAIFCYGWCFGGRRQVEKDHAQTIS